MSMNYLQCQVSSFFPEPTVEEIEEMRAQNRARGHRIALRLVVIILLGIVLVLSQASFQVPSGHVVYDGRVSPNSHVYRRWDGEYVVNVQERNRGTGTLDNTLYVLRPAQHEVSFIASESVRLSPGLLFL